MSMFRRVLCGVGVGLAAGLVGTAGLAASITDPGLTGSVQYDEWTANGLSTAANPGFPGFPWTEDWPRPIESDLGGDAQLFRTARSNGMFGGPTPAGSSLYFGGTSADPNVFGGTLAVVDATPVTGLANVVFQIKIGEAFGYDFFDHVLPVLSFNGGSQNLAATYHVVDQEPNGTFDTPAGPQDLYNNTYLLQWDLTGYSNIAEFAISFSGVEHAQVYGMRLDQSDVYESLAPAAAVPEPTSIALLACGLGIALRAARKRR